MVAPGSTYESTHADVRNGVIMKNGQAGQLGQVNVYSKVTSQNNGLSSTDFTFMLQDPTNNNAAVTLENWGMQFFDFDVDKDQTLNEQMCINFNQFDKDSQFSMVPTNPDLKVESSDKKGCDGTNVAGGSISVESHGVGFLCDNPSSHSDMDNITCTQCLSSSSCNLQRNADLFPVHPDSRVVGVGFKDQSKFTLRFTLKCNKPQGQDCTRNFLFGGINNACKKCDLSQQPVTIQPLALTDVVENNLGNLGPNNGDEKQIRYSKVGTTLAGTQYDLIIEAVNGDRDPYLTFNPSKNGIAGPGVGSINLATAVPSGATSAVTNTRFKFSYVETGTLKPVTPQKIVWTIMDLDRDDKKTLHESICVDVSQIHMHKDAEHAIPGYIVNPLGELVKDGGIDVNTLDVKVTHSKKGCDGTGHKGSYVIQSKEVGFQCDNPTASALGVVSCDQCFGQTQCVNKGQYFPIMQSKRVVSIQVWERSSFTVDLGVECIKPGGQTCTRNLIFRAVSKEAKPCPVY